MRGSVSLGEPENKKWEFLVRLGEAVACLGEPLCLGEERLCLGKLVTV